MMIPNRPNSKLKHDKLPLAGRGFNRTYPANSSQPELVLDAGENYYRKDGSRDSFSNTFTHSRASGATYLDSTGTLQTAASGVLRDNAYTYVDGVLTGPYIQHESAAATNLVTYSEDASNGIYSSNGVTISTNQSVAPDGNAAMDALVEDTSTGVHQDSFQLNFAAATVYCFSRFIKANGRNRCRLITTSPGMTDALAIFDLSSGAVVTASGCTALIENVGVGIYRVSQAFTTVTGGVSTLRTRTDNGSLDSYTGDGSSGLFVWGTQVEQSSIPSSYIHTSGSTATRAAEALTIDNPPWPATVEATGTELVTNGGFDTDTDWTKVGTASISGGVGVIPGVSSLRQSFATVVGAIYKWDVDITQASNKGILRVGTTSGGFDVYNDTAYRTTAGVKTVLFVAASTTTHISILNDTSPSGDMQVDNISVKEITPRGLAIAMDGLVTYADLGVLGTATFWQWRADADNYINPVLSTSGANAGQLNFAQESLNTYDSVVESSPGSYSPGINVPFSIASRHGDNFINGAVDGTALTADLTPTILPDLSSTAIQIGSTFNGYIDTLRIWDVDIGDTGIEEASA